MPYHPSRWTAEAASALATTLRLRPECIAPRPASRSHPRLDCAAAAAGAAPQPCATDRLGALPRQLLAWRLAMPMAARRTLPQGTLPAILVLVARKPGAG